MSAHRRPPDGPTIPRSGAGRLGLADDLGAGTPDRAGPPPTIVAGGLARLLPLRNVRCECAVCGVHVIVTASLTIGGWCHNCGSCDLRPLLP